MDVLPARPGAKLEAASPRFMRELIHPNRQNLVQHIWFSKDGEYVSALDTPDGLLQTWEVATGKQLPRGNTLFGTPGSRASFTLSPDCKTLFVRRERRKPERIDGDGGPVVRWRFESSLQAWEMTTGQLVRDYRHEPPRNTNSMILSPDGRKLLAREDVPVVTKGHPPRAATLWDVRTGLALPLPVDACWGIFSRDSRTIAYAEYDTERRTRVIKLLDTASGQEQRVIRLPPNTSEARPLAFTPDGSGLMGMVLYWDDRQPNQWEVTFLVWDTATGRELVTLPGRPNTHFGWPVMTPDGRTCSINAHRDPQGKLYLLDMGLKQIRKTVILGNHGDDQKTSPQVPVFSPDGKWMAVISHTLPNKPSAELRQMELPQARVCLIDVATGEVRERMIVPPGSVVRLCFSPDGKTLAVGGMGKVLLADLTQPPGTVDATQRK